MPQSERNKSDPTSRLHSPYPPLAERRLRGKGPQTPSTCHVATASPTSKTGASQIHKAPLPSSVHEIDAGYTIFRNGMENAGLDVCTNIWPTSEGSQRTITRPTVANQPYHTDPGSPSFTPAASPSETTHRVAVSPPGPALQGPQQTFLNNAQNFHMRDLRHTSTSIGVARNVTVNAQSSFYMPPPLAPVNGWAALIRESAPNALHDSKARYDPPKCDEDTRVEVISEITNWIEDRESPQRLLCMTGAAGSGKSALQQTMAEICCKSNTLGSAYFFGAADPTRNTASTLIPTIAYQLGLSNPAVKEHIRSAVERDDLIFSRSLQSQMKTLVCDPVRRLRAAGKLNLTSFGYVILIDGLDECQGEDHQSEILKAVKECLLDKDLPFRVFIASRPEWALRSMLEPGGELNELAYHIQLSDQYDTTGDIRRYLWRSLRELGPRSNDPRARSPGWFTHEDIEQLVTAASGQFIYAATVVRYLSERRSSPVDRLRIVLTWTPANSHLARPFEKLDLLYHNILSAAKIAYEAVDTHRNRDFLLLFRIYHFNSSQGFTEAHSDQTFCVSNEELDDFLQMESGAHGSVMSDLRSLVAIRRSTSRSSSNLHIYHKSLSDFLSDRSRSRDLFVPDSRVHTHLAACFLRNVVRRTGWASTLGPRFSGFDWWSPMYFLKQSLRKHLLEITDDLVDFTRQGGWKILAKSVQMDLKPGPCNLNHLWSDLDWMLVSRAAILDLRNRKPQVAMAMSEFQDCVKIPASSVYNWKDDRDSKDDARVHISFLKLAQVMRK